MQTRNRDDLLPLSAIVLVACALRFACAAWVQNTIYPDEIFQIQEFAHHLAFGDGILAWEWYAGIRSYLFPGLVAGLMLIGRELGSDPAWIMLPVQIFMVGASLTPVVCGYLWGLRLGGRRAAIIVGAVTAVWVDLVYAAPHTLNEVLASDLIVAMLYVGYPAGATRSPGRLAVAGALAGLTFVLRMHMAPALLVAAIFICNNRPRAWLAFALGGLAPLLVSGLLDWATLGTPFQSLWLNLWLNVFQHVSEEFGVISGGNLVTVVLLFWGSAAVLIIGLAIIGAQRLPPLLAVSAVIVATHLLFAHKEYRFILPAFAPLIILAALATADLISLLERQFGDRFSSPAALPACAIVAWAAVSMLVALSPAYLLLWQHSRAEIDAFALAAHDPDICALGLVDELWLRTPGSAALPPGIPILAATSDTLVTEGDGFNDMIAPATTPIGDPRFVSVACFEGDLNSAGMALQTLCLFHRAGACYPERGHKPDVNWPRYFLTGSGQAIRETLRGTSG